MINFAVVMRKEQDNFLKKIIKKYTLGLNFKSIKDIHKYYRYSI